MERRLLATCAHLFALLLAGCSESEGPRYFYQLECPGTKPVGFPGSLQVDGSGDTWACWQGRHILWEQLDPSAVCHVQPWEGH